MEALNELILFFDVDMTLYPASTGINQLMTERIHSYCVEFLDLTLEEAKVLTHGYYKDYGLAIRGLLRHHENVDPAHFDTYVDGWLPLEDILKEDAVLLEKMQSCPFKKYAFTNAGIRHAERVISLLGLSRSKINSSPDLYKSLHEITDVAAVSDKNSRAGSISHDRPSLTKEQVTSHSCPSTNFKSVFEKVIYTDYTDPNFSCKPEKAVFEKALIAAGFTNVHIGTQKFAQCVLFDDSRLNVEAALSFGWKAVLVEESSSVALKIEKVVGVNQPDLFYPIIQSIHSFPEALQALQLTL